MRWHEWPLLQKELGYHRTAVNEWYPAMADEAFKKGERETGHLLEREGRWAYSKRPYYSVYPAAVQALLSLNIGSIQASAIPAQPIGDLLIRFAIGSDAGGVASILCGAMICVDDEGNDIPTNEEHGAILFARRVDSSMSQFAIQFRPGRTVFECLNSLYPNMQSWMPGAIERVKIAIQVYCGIMLFDKSAGLIIPDVLTDDQEKYDAATSDAERERLVQRARNRGKYGWTIGKNLEVSPHFRRPHLGIRWTEKGRSVPKIVPIKGCVVKREKIGHIPTGYLDAPLCTSCKMLPAVDGNECAECLAVTV